MTDPAVHNKNFGGVNFNWNEVKSAKVVKGKNGKETYFIEFKTGVKAEYPVQNGASMNSRELTMWQSLDYDNETVINGMQGATITGSQSDDHIVANGVKGCTINVANDNNDDHVDIVENDEYFSSYGGLHEATNSEGNKIILDKKDTAKNKYIISNGNLDAIGAQEVNVQGPGVENRF